jgi:hypothetical protein
METIVITHNGLEIRHDASNNELIIQSREEFPLLYNLEDIFVEKSRKKKWDKNKPFWDKG